MKTAILVGREVIECLTRRNFDLYNSHGILPPGLKN